MPGRIHLKSRANKYHSKRVTVDGQTFDSNREYSRWGELCLMQQAGSIAELRRQVAVECWVNGVLVATWRADFVYRDLALRGKPIVHEDCKGCRTREYLLKKRLVKACHGIEIRET